MALLASLSGAAPAENATSPIPTGPVKWHPGHYVTLTPFDNDRPGYFDEVLDEISRYPVLRGIQKRYLWSDLEKQPGHYDFLQASRNSECRSFPISHTESAIVIHSE